MFVCGNYCADGADQRDTLKDCWSTLVQYLMAFYGNMMKQDRLFYKLRFVNFSDIKNEPDKTYDNDDQLWKIRAIFNMLNDLCAKCYNLTEHLAVDEIIVFFKGRVIIKQCIRKKHKCFAIKLYKLCDSKGYTYNMTV